MDSCEYANCAPIHQQTSLTGMESAAGMLLHALDDPLGTGKIIQACNSND
jgi:hypothetical protein